VRVQRRLGELNQYPKSRRGMLRWPLGKQTALVPYSQYTLLRRYPKESIPAGPVWSVRNLKLATQSLGSTPLRKESQDAECRTFSMHPSRKEDNTSPPKSITNSTSRSIVIVPVYMRGIIPGCQRLLCVEGRSLVLGVSSSLGTGVSI
jgi:hypothetical protein